MRLVWLAIIGVLVLLAAACSGERPSSEDKTSGLDKPPTVAAGQKVDVIATTTQATDFTRVVGGDRVSVTGLIKPGVDAHEFEPTPQDAQAVSRANLIVVNGAGLEAFLDKLLEQAGKGKPVVDLSTGVKLRKGSGDEEQEADPHIWFSPLNAKIMVDNLAGALARVDPSGAAAYKTNAEAYKKQLDALDASIRAQINTVPEDRRKMVTNHDAFGYYIDRYGLTFVGSVIPSLETNAEPSAQEIADLITRIKEQKVPAVFTESSVNPKLEQQIAQDAGVKVVSTLYSDSLGEPGSAGATYLGMMDYNTKTIVDALR